MDGDAHAVVVAPFPSIRVEAANVVGGGTKRRSGGGEFRKIN